MKTKLKLSTLVHLAKEIEKEHGVTVRRTVAQMWEELARIAGHCRTVADARQTIAAKIYQITK